MLRRWDVSRSHSTLPFQMTVIVVKVTESSLGNLCLACPHLRGFIKNDITSAFVMKLTACLLWFLWSVILYSQVWCNIICLKRPPHYTEDACHERRTFSLLIWNMKIRLSLLIAAVTFPVFAVILKCSSVTVSPMRSVHPPELLETWYGRLSEGILHDRAQREKERMSFYLLPASCLLQDACQLRQSTVEGSKRQNQDTSPRSAVSRLWHQTKICSAESFRKVISRQY